MSACLQLKPSNLQEEQTVFWRLAGSFGRRNFRKNKVLGGAKTCLMMFANYAARHFLGKQQKKQAKVCAWSSLGTKQAIL